LRLQELAQTSPAGFVAGLTQALAAMKLSAEDAAKVAAALAN
jgi:hypothetical protein